MSELATALGLVLVIEGVLYAAFPRGMKEVMAAAQALPEDRLRTAGMVAIAAGIGLVWLVRGG